MEVNYDDEVHGVCDRWTNKVSLNIKYDRKQESPCIIITLFCLLSPPPTTNLPNLSAQYHRPPTRGGDGDIDASHSAPEDFLRPPNTLDIFLTKPLDFEPAAAPVGAVGAELVVPLGAASDEALALGLLKCDEAPNSLP